MMPLFGFGGEQYLVGQLDTVACDGAVHQFDVVTPAGFALV